MTRTKGAGMFWLSISAFVCAFPAALMAQGLMMPGAAWGAVQLPSPDPYCEVGTSQELFTDSTKSEDYAKNRYVRYGADSTVGYNTAFLSCDVSLLRRVPWRAITLRVTGAVGVVNDDLTRFLQNRFVHRDGDLNPIPRGNVARNRTYYVGEVRMHRWFDQAAVSRSHLRLRGAAFLGLGGSLGGPFQVASVEAGYRMRVLEIANMRMPTVSFMLSKGVYLQSDNSWSSRWLSNSFNYRQVLASIPLNEWFNGAGMLPAINVGLTSSSGLFRDSGSPHPRREAAPNDTTPRSIAERFCSIGVSWLDGNFSAETYNDTCGDKDQGPTFGLRLLVRWRSF